MTRVQKQPAQVHTPAQAHKAQETQQADVAKLGQTVAKQGVAFQPDQTLGTSQAAVKPWKQAAGQTAEHLAKATQHHKPKPGAQE